MLCHHSPALTHNRSAPSTAELGRPSVTTLNHNPVLTECMSSRSPRDDELADRLDELEETLSALRSELRSDSARRPPRPPSLGELLRFTEQYTIPTLIAMLEATIKSLELLRRTMRLADPKRAVREETSGARTELDRLGSQASEELARGLSELRTALSEANLPENPESRRLVEDARSLTREIEDRIREAEGDVRASRDRTKRDQPTQSTNEIDRSRTRDSDGGVFIDVTDDDKAANSTETDGSSGSNDEQLDDPIAIDVDAELEAIKQDLDPEEDVDEDDSGRSESQDEASVDSHGADQDETGETEGADETGENDAAAESGKNDETPDDRKTE